MEVSKKQRIFFLAPIEGFLEWNCGTSTVLLMEKTRHSFQKYGGNIRCHRWKKRKKAYMTSSIDLFELERRDLKRPEVPGI